MFVTYTYIDDVRNLSIYILKMFVTYIYILKMFVTYIYIEDVRNFHIY